MVAMNRYICGCTGGRVELESMSSTGRLKTDRGKNEMAENSQSMQSVRDRHWLEGTAALLLANSTTANTWITVRRHEVTQ